MERVATGITGFDKLIEGGIPKGFNVLVVGEPGTGKTIFGLQYLYNGALAGENGMYITLDADADKVREQARRFDWNIDDLESQGKLQVLGVPLNKKIRVNLFKMLEDKARAWDIKRIVFDSLSSFTFNLNQFMFQFAYIDDLSKVAPEDRKYLGEDPLYRQNLPRDVFVDRPDPSVFGGVRPEQRMVYLALRELSSIGTTNIIITSDSADSMQLTTNGVSEYASDGVVKLEVVDMGGGPSRLLKVLKMRYTKNALEFHDFEINEKGFSVS